MKTIIKWTGSKRYQAPCIVDKFHKTINTYFEPFLGGGSVLGELLERLEAGTYKCSITRVSVDIKRFCKCFCSVGIMGAIKYEFAEAFKSIFPLCVFNAL